VRGPITLVDVQATHGPRYRGSDCVCRPELAGYFGVRHHASLWT
jgi:hypothetical protein